MNSLAPTELFDSRWRVKSLAIFTSLCLVPMALTGPVRAACVSGYTAHPSAASLFEAAVPDLLPAVYRSGDHTGRALATDFESRSPSIVGVWQFQSTGIAPDLGTQAWHADGTEFMYSLAPNPATGDVCQGVWQQVGPRTFTVNHVAMGWSAPGADPSKGSPFLRIHLHYVITLDPSGDKFHGTYKADIFLENESDPFNEDPVSNPPIASGGGTVTATRLQPDLEH